MNIVDNILIIDDKIEYEDSQEFIDLASSDIVEIVVDTNDVHPAIFQLLLVMSKDNKIIIEDEFNKRFFDNLKLTD